MFDEYPECSPEFLSQYSDEDPSDCYTVDRIENARPERNAAVTSLFIANCSNLFPNHNPCPSREEGGIWWTRYVAKLFESVAFFDTYHTFQDWKLRIYLCPTLVDLIPRFLTRCPRVEFYIMKRPSVSHSPGTLWRFLPLEDTSLDLGCIFDCDDLVLYTLPCIDALRNSPNMGISRILPRISEWIIPGVVMKYSAMWANSIIFRPSVLQIPFKRLLLQFIAYRKSVFASDAPWQYPGQVEPTLYTAPSGHMHLFGWGNHWYNYNFDERVLKHVVYPYVIRKGVLQTTVFAPWKEDDPIEMKRDIEYVKSNPANEILELFTK